MADEQAPALGLGGEIRIFGEVIVQPLVRPRHLARGQRDPVEEADDALGHRAEVVQRPRPEGDAPEVLAPGDVRPLEVALGGDAPVADDQHAMHVAPAGEAVDAPGEVGGEAEILRLARDPVTGRVCRPGAAQRERSGAEQKPAAGESEAIHHRRMLLCCPTHGIGISRLREGARRRPATGWAARSGRLQRPEATYHLAGDCGTPLGRDLAEIQLIASGLPPSFRRDGVIS